MKQLQINAQLKQVFRSNPRTLIFEGYCDNFSNVTIYNDGSNYALTVLNNFGATECCIFSDSTQFIDSVFATLRGRIKICGVSTFVTDYLASKYDFLWLTHCTLYAWNGKPLDLSVFDCSPRCDIRPLDQQYAQQVSDGTPYHADLDDVRLCLTKHPSAAIYIDGKPVCWCLLHLEGDLGMLYTLPEYRHKGYALKVMTALTDKVIKSGNIPYCFIIKGNVASENLALKYNLQPICDADYFEINTDSIK